MKPHHRPAGISQELLLRLAAEAEGIFPPASPSSRRRGGKVLHQSHLFMDCVCWLLDAIVTGDTSPAQEALGDAMTSGSLSVFLKTMAEAHEHVLNLDATRSAFANCVVAARRIAAASLESTGELPARQAAIDGVIATLGNLAPPQEQTARWSEILKAAGLSGLARKSSARLNL